MGYVHRLLLSLTHVREPEFWNPGNFYLWNPESGRISLGFVFRNTAQGIQDPCSTDKDWDAAPGIRNPRRGIPNPRLHSSSARLRYFFISHRSRDIFQKFEGKSVENTVEPLGTYGHLANTDTPLLRTVSNVPTKLSYILFKKPSSIRTLANTDNGH